jgi:RNAse (barnase) inhibitor barstar
MPPVDRLAVPVIFRTPVIKDALAVWDIIMNAIKLIVAILFIRVPPSRKLRFRNFRKIMYRACRKRHEDHMRTLLMWDEDANAKKKGASR